MGGGELQGNVGRHLRGKSIFRRDSRVVVPAGPAFGVDFGGFRDLARSAGDDDAVVRQPRKRLDIDRRLGDGLGLAAIRSEEHTSELQSLMRISYAVFRLKKKIYKPCTTSRQTKLSD